MQLVSNGPRDFLAQLAYILTLEASFAGTFFDCIQLTDVGQHRSHACRVGFARLIDVPSGVRKATHFHEFPRWFDEKLVVARYASNCK